MNILAKDRLIILLLDQIERLEKELSEITSAYNEIRRIKNQVANVDLDVLKGKPHSEVSKLKLFMDTFNLIQQPNGGDVLGEALIEKLIESGHFTEEESDIYIKKAMQNGQIYERKTGWYAKA